MTLSDSESSCTTRTRLIEAAIFCFAEKGFDATGIREIAKLAQANSALVQYHFGGKEGLYRETLRHIFQHRPPALAAPPEDPAAADARPRAIQAIRQMIYNLVEELMSCSNGTDLDRAALFLVTRELQAPRPEVAPLLLEHIRPYSEQLEICLRILLPGLERTRMLNMVLSVYGQIFHLHSNLNLIRIMREDPGFPADLQALADHFADFSLRGIGIPEAFKSIGA